MKPNKALTFFFISILLSGCALFSSPDRKVVLFQVKDYKIGQVVLAEGMWIDAVGVNFQESGQTTTTVDSDLKAGVLYNYSKRPDSPVSEFYISIPREVAGTAYVSAARLFEGKPCPEQWARDRLGKWCEIKTYPDISYP